MPREHVQAPLGKRSSAAALRSTLVAGVCFFLLAAPMPLTPFGPPAPLAKGGPGLWRAPSSNNLPFLSEPLASPIPGHLREEARALNDRIPFVTTPFRIAPSFVFAGDANARARAVDCLAAASYYEAGNDERGQRAVIQVVLNRVRNPAYPSSVCGVVFQGAERTTGCQFTFTCDGSMARRRPSPSSWAQAQSLARDGLDGYSDATVGHATHFHTDWVHPRWSQTLDKIAAVRTHLFFQAHAHRPGRFSEPYSGAEPRIAALSSLSPAHRDNHVSQNSSSADLEIGFAPPALPHAPPFAPAQERLPDQAELPDDGIFLVTLDARQPESFRDLGLRLCAGREQCKLIGWTQARDRPTHFPIPGTAVDTISFVFTRGSNTDKAQWNCREFPRQNQAECLYATS